MRHGSSFLGQQVVYDEGSLYHFNGLALGHSSSQRPGGGGGSSTPPSPTLVVTAGSNLEFNLVWDSSVNNLGTNKAAFMSALTNVVHYFETLFTTPTTEIINIKVGWGVVNTSALPASALGASQTSGYLTNFTTVANALTQDGFSFSATNEPTTAQFFISSAEAKSFGLINP